MAILKFNAKKVEKLVQHALAAVQHTRSYGQHNDPDPALHLVLDGMYLISNGEPYLPGSAFGESTLNAVVYAEGYEPPDRLPQVSDELVTAARLVREEQGRGTCTQDSSVDSWAASVERLSPAEASGGVPRLPERRGVTTLANCHTSAANAS
jgi:hypothetical protein